MAYSPHLVLKIEGQTLKGVSTQFKDKGTELLSFALSADLPFDHHQGVAHGRVSYSPISITKRMDEDTTLILTGMSQQKKASGEILTKYLRSADQRYLAETVEIYAEHVPKAPYPTLSGIKTVLDLFYPDKARAVNPSDFADMRFVRELEESGFIGRLY
jgi:hypothetical protein